MYGTNHFGWTNLKPLFILFGSCVDNSGKWGHGGMFDALAKLSPGIDSAYEGAAKFGDLHLGDLHLIKIEGSTSPLLVLNFCCHAA